jgi:glycerophosphoryl diester phosphodiesterase
MMLKPPHRPWVVAHRGASLDRPENTIAAFREAEAQGADAVELDVRRTGDGALVVHHDAAIPGVGAIIELDRVTLREHAPLVPDLDAALRACAGMWVDVEIKNSPADPDWDPDRTIVPTVAAVINEAGASGRVLVSSFDPGTVAEAARCGLKTGWLAGRAVDPIEAVETIASAGHVAFLPNAGGLAGDSAACVAEAAHAAGLLVLAWTVDDPEEIRRLARSGLDGLITNIPATALSALEHGDGDRG